jgi:hypothetical protein
VGIKHLIINHVDLVEYERVGTHIYSKGENNMVTNLFIENMLKRRLHNHKGQVISPLCVIIVFLSKWNTKQIVLLVLHM